MKQDKDINLSVNTMSFIETRGKRTLNNFDFAVYEVLRLLHAAFLSTSLFAYIFQPNNDI